MMPLWTWTQGKCLFTPPYCKGCARNQNILGLFLSKYPQRTNFKNCVLSNLKTTTHTHTHTTQWGTERWRDGKQRNRQRFPDVVYFPNAWTKLGCVRSKWRTNSALSWDLPLNFHDLWIQTEPEPLNSIMKWGIVKCILTTAPDNNLPPHTPQLSGQCFMPF